MAIISCYECDKEFSDTRVDCPNCGAYQKGMAPTQTKVTNIELKLMDWRISESRSNGADMPRKGHYPESG